MRASILVGLCLTVGCSSTPSTTTQPLPAVPPVADAGVRISSPSPDAALVAATLSPAELAKIVNCYGQYCNVNTPITDVAARMLTQNAALRKQFFLVHLPALPSVAKIPWVQKLWIKGGGTLDAKHVTVFKDLRRLSIDHADIVDFKGLASLTKLERLTVSPKSVTSLSGLEKLTKLRHLGLGNMPNLAASELSKISGLSELEYLGLAHIKSITDLSALAKLPKLNHLELTRLPVKNLRPLRRHPSLTWVQLNSLEQLRDLAPLGTLPKLKELTIAYMPKVRYTGIGTAKSLELLTIETPSMTQIPRLRGMRYLKVLNVSGNPKLRDIRSLGRAGMRSLTKIQLRGTQVVSLRALSQLRKLEHVDIRGTKVRRIMPLVGIRSLKLIWTTMKTSKVVDAGRFEKQRPKVELKVQHPKRR